MARTRMTAKRYRRVTTWTRFHLPREQEWPTWTVAHADVHVGPLADVEGHTTVRVGRMLEDPEQAAYIIDWRDLSDLENFQSSPACAAFLRNLPENDNLEVFVASTSSVLRSLTIGDAPSSSSSQTPLRFLILEESSGIPRAEVEGRVTLNTFLIPHKGGDASTKRTWYESVREVLGRFQPRGSEFIRGSGLHWQRYMTTWFWALAEDGWVESKFGNSEQTQDDIDMQGRSVLCEFHLWPQKYGATPEHEEASAADPQARESWKEAVAKVMPPVTAWVQERWDILEVPRFYPPEEPEEIDSEYERQLQEQFGENYLSPEERRTPWM